MGFMKGLKEDFYKAFNELISDDDIDDVLDLDQEDINLIAITDEEPIINIKDHVDDHKDKKVTSTSKGNKKNKIMNTRDKQKESKLVNPRDYKSNNKNVPKSNKKNFNKDPKNITESSTNKITNKPYELSDSHRNNLEDTFVTYKRPKEEERVGDLDKVTLIQEGTIISGDIKSNCSLEVLGTVTGDIDCGGKLSIIGLVNGNCKGSQVYVETKRLEGCIEAEKDVKIGVDSIVIGDIKATSLEIHGAVKGEVDVNGPVTLDSSAVVKGNIKAQSIEVSNGAVIDGFCNLSYATTDIDNMFE